MMPAARLQLAALLIAAWLGAALITVAVVAPGAFAVLPSRSMAGTMVGRVLPVLFDSGIAIGVIAAAMSGGLNTTGPARRAFATGLLISLACAVAQFGITPRIERLRQEIGGPIEALAQDDPRRVAFGLYHGYSVAGLGVAMAAAAVCLAFLLFANRSGR